MSSSDHRTSVSPSERQRAKSRSSSRSRRTPPGKIASEENARREKTPSQTSKRNTRETNPIKSSGSSTSNRSRAGVSPTSKRRKSNVKTPTSPKSKSKSPTSNRKASSKRKKSTVSISDADSKQSPEANNSEKQDLTARGFSIVPAEIFELINLRRLILSNNNLSDLSPNIRSLVNLEHLDISRNPLRVKNGLDDYSCLPREFRYLKNLRTLIMAECTLKHVPVVVWNTVSLQTLDISRNKVGYIVGEIGNLTDIRHLRLSQMNLDTLPPEIGFCDKLETIDLTGNPIDNLPETLVECRHLYEFKINYKTFYKLLDNYMLQLIDEGKIRSEHIPQVIFELENLRILDLDQTKLNSIPNENILVNLKELYLSNNSFFEIPQAICTMEQLKVLDMSHNRLQNIPDYFVNIKQLETFVLSYNNLIILPKIFARLSTLKKLIVSHNQLTTIEDGFSQSRSLLTLDISYNNLKSIPDEICDLELLESLDLRYNQLEYLPLTIRRMIGIKSMNTFDENFQRTGLHLLGNSITDPASYIWKSTNIQTLFDYIETREKILSKNFHHVKLILIGPKNIGKTTLTIKLLNDRKINSNTRKTLDMYVSILQEKQIKLNEQDIDQQQQTSSDVASSAITDQWIENRVSTGGDHLLNRRSNAKRIYPPPLSTYRSNELFENILNKSTLITTNNLYCTIFDLKSEPSFEIIYPLIYDSNALFILPVNLTILLNILQAATSLENIDEDDNQITIIDFDALLTYDWLYSHIFRYIESISDHCEQASIAVIGLIMNRQIAPNDQQLLDEIHLKVNMFLNDEGDQRKNIHLYSEYFPQPIHLEDQQMSSVVIEQLEIIAQQWSFTHHKQKRQILKQRLGFTQQDSLIIDYTDCLKRFEQEDQSSSIASDDENEDEENKQLIENEINQMNFDECLDYLKLTGDILCFGQIPQMIIIIKPYYLLNDILSRTLFRPRIDQWLNYDDNIVFHFSGYYPTQEIFNIDRQRLLTRGEYTWKMLNVLFYEQNNNSLSLIEQNIIDYCRLMDRLHLGYLNESNLNYQEFTTVYFVCPWLMNEKSMDIDYMDYFKLLEQKRQYEHLQCDRARRIKQQQLWFATDDEQEYNLYENVSKTNTNNYSQQQKNSLIEINIEDLPSIDRIEIVDSQIVNQDSIQRIKITNEYSNFLPNGLYERLLICLHPLFNERLDYYNITLGRTIEKNLIKIERPDTQNQIYITINNCLFERIENILIRNLFSFYPTINLQIET